MNAYAHKLGAKYHAYLPYHDRALCGLRLAGSRNGAAKPFDESLEGACNRCRRIVREAGKK